MGSAEDNKTLACVGPKALSAVFTEDKFQEPLEGQHIRFREVFREQVGLRKRTCWLQEAKVSEGMCVLVAFFGGQKSSSI